jgi:hypothetical protein
VTRVGEADHASRLTFPQISPSGVAVMKNWSHLTQVNRWQTIWIRAVVLMIVLGGIIQLAIVPEQLIFLWVITRLWDGEA